MMAAYAGYVIDTVGKILIAHTAIAVHSRLFKEQKVDNGVLMQIHDERKYAIAGIVLIVIGFVLQTPEKLHLL